MDYDLSKLIKRAQTAFDSWMPHTESGTHTDSIHRDSFDEYDWKNLRDEVPVLNTNIDKLKVKFDYVDDFFEDFFNLLHQGDPMVRDESEMLDSRRPNRTMSTEFKDMPEVEGLRLSTMHDVYSTAMAMVSMQPKLEEAYKRTSAAQQAAREEQQRREELREAMRQLAQALANAEQVDPDDEDAQEQAAQGLQEAMDALEAAGGVLIDAGDQARAEAGQAARAARNALRQAANQAADERAEEQELMRAFGVEDGELQRMSFAERKRLSERLKNNRLAKFAKMIGQFRTIQSAESRRKVVHSPDEVVGVELGDNLQRMTAGEMSNLAEPLLEDEFWLRWANQRLLQYKLSGHEKLGQGPIIVVCDESGSMSGSYFGGIDLAGGTPEAWSKALALALCEQARRGGRDFYYIGFSSYNQQWTCFFEKGRAPLEKVIQFTEHFFNGGTHYEKPMMMALEIVERYGADDKPKPDVVFITDDEYQRPDKDFLERWQTARHKLSMKVYGIVIGHQSSGALDALSDNVRSITEMSSDPSVMRDIFRTI